MIDNILVHIESFFGSQPILLFTTSLFILLKLYLLIKFTVFNQEAPNTQRARIFLMIFLASSIIVDSVWVLRLVRDMFLGPIDYRPYLLWLRFAWSMLIIQYNALAFFLESLVSPF